MRGSATSDPQYSLAIIPIAKRQEGIRTAAQERVHQNGRENLESRNRPADRADRAGDDRLDHLVQLQIVELAGEQTTWQRRWHKDASSLSSDGR